MRCMTAFDQRTDPAEVMATTASCMESSMTASSSRPLSSSAKSLPSRTAVSLRAASIEESASMPVNGPGSMGIASMRAVKSPSAMRRAKVTTLRKRTEMRREMNAARGMATASAMRPAQRASPPSTRKRRATRVLHKTVKGKLDDQRVEHEEDDKKSEQPDKYFGGHERQLLAFSL